MGTALTTAGRIPFELRIGVTGHRRIADAGAVGAQVAAVVARIRASLPATPETPVGVTAVSSLAEGADRIVAEEILRGGGQLEAVLPLAKDEFERDFKSAASRRAFRSLLEHASVVIENDRPSARDAGYELSGRYVVERCDALIAIWDGKPSRGRGGTAEVMAYAESRGVPTYWIDANNPDRVVERPGAGLPTGPLAELGRYNAEAISSEQVATHASAVRRDLVPALPNAGRRDGDRLGVGPTADWILPYFARADILAVKLQRRYLHGIDWVFGLAALATAVVAVQAIFLEDIRWLVLIEIFILLSLLVRVGVGRRQRLKQRWLSCRFLAERFRSALFLALAGLSNRREGGYETMNQNPSSEEWLRRAFTAVWREHPQTNGDSAPVDELREFLASAWIRAQAEYHERTSAKHEARIRWFSVATNAMFGVTVLAAVGHIIFELPAFTFLSITLPAVAAAVNGMGEQREYHRHADRYERMVGYLAAAEARMRSAADHAAVQAIAAETETVMAQETQDWFGVMQFHDFKLA